MVGGVRNETRNLSDLVVQIVSRVSVPGPCHTLLFVRTIYLVLYYEFALFFCLVVLSVSSSL